MASVDEESTKSQMSNANANKMGAIGEVGFDSLVDGGGSHIKIGKESHISVAIEGSDIKLVNPELSASQSQSMNNNNIPKESSEQPVNFAEDASKVVGNDSQSKKSVHTDADVERLQLIISDLSRRLQNAQHTIDAQREISKKSTALAERFRRELGEAHNRLRLETAKNVTTARKKVHAEEAARFEHNKEKSTKMHDDVRMALLDRQMQGMRTTSNKIEKMKKDLTRLEAQHESQKQLLLHLGEMDKMTEELSNAAQHGNLQGCATLIKRGARINELDSAGYLPLFYAAAFGHTACLKLLLEFGTDPSSYLSGHSSIEAAAQKGHTACVKVLIRFGADLEDMGLRGTTALNSAVAGGHVECAIALLDAGADISGRNMNEDTPLHVATALTNPVPLIRLLIKKGADLNVVNRQGHTPVRMAIANANAMAVDALGGRAAMVPMEDGQLFNGSEHGEDMIDEFSMQDDHRHGGFGDQGSIGTMSQVTMDMPRSGVTRTVQNLNKSRK